MLLTLYLASPLCLPLECWWSTTLCLISALTSKLTLRKLGISKSTCLLPTLTVSWTRNVESLPSRLLAATKFSKTYLVGTAHSTGWATAEVFLQGLITMRSPKSSLRCQPQPSNYPFSNYKDPLRSVYLLFSHPRLKPLPSRFRHEKASSLLVSH